MKIIQITSLPLPEVKVVRFARFCDDRGYFTETFRNSDLLSHPELAKDLQGVQFLQVNESYSKPNVIRGLHFQVNPPMGKLVRVLFGEMFDFAMDVRPDSSNFGKIVGYHLVNGLDSQSARKENFSEWIWLPPGFAHGVCFLKESAIEYFCTCEYNPAGELGISPLSPDLDWSLCNSQIKDYFLQMTTKSTGMCIISDKDRNSPTLTELFPNKHLKKKL
ncbi:MAG: dTDP-4-dehydrorhamnose 3,5-epimerase family protein [Oligoflexia bacterium]|nr:dTDP-4-dehydrorhamnose 3,5-epimerase family protein [Oligoflexia bacterium]